jgi:ABC-type branched-subunit amino acid transport system ATPase component
MTILLVGQYRFCKELADNFAILDRGNVVRGGSMAELTDEVVKGTSPLVVYHASQPRERKS